MLGWLFPTCPVSPYEKAWTEQRTAWLIDRFGPARLLGAKTILPDEACFPDEYHGLPEDAHALLRRLCGFMEIDPARVSLEITEDDQLPDAAGCYDRSDPSRRPVIRVRAEQLSDPEALVATLAHELAHELLLGSGLMTGDEPDHEWTTDLLPVCLGLGVFLANAALREDTARSGSWSWWTLRRQGYLPSRMVGYAMALQWWLRRESRPPGTAHLRPDAKAAVVGGLRYLRRTGDCTLQPETLHAERTRRERSDPDELLQVLHHGSPSARISAMWRLNGEESDALPALAGLMRRRQRDVRAQAATTLAQFGSAAEPYLADLIDLLHDPDPQVRVAACHALGELALDLDDTVAALGAALNGDFKEVTRAGAAALTRLGPAAAAAEVEVLRALHAALIDCDDATIDLLVATLRSTAADPGASINDYFHERDPEYREAAIDALYRDEHGGMLYGTEHE